MPRLPRFNATIATKLLVNLVAVLLLRAYVRVRHWLLSRIDTAVPVGAAASVAWTSAVLLPVGAALHLGHLWGSIMVLCLACRPLYILGVIVSTVHS